MIGRIQGTLLEKQAPLLLVDVNGVGYEVLAPMTTLYQLPAIGDTVVLHTHLVVREDAQVLYGFINQRDRSLFQTLIRVNGVGPRLALTILSGMEIDDFVRSVRAGDSAALVRLPGVGKKTAERLVVEMRDRLKDWVVTGAPAAGVTAPVQEGDLVAEAESALVALGYKPAEASKAIAAVIDDSITRSEQLIRQALKNMVN